ncbi:MAG: DUF998 domain-containing protein [Nitrososphaerales archaeon]
MVKSWEKIIKPKVVAWFGIIAPLWALLSIGISIALSPWFSWTNNALSDLGVSSVSLIFNIGLIMSGIFASLFIISLVTINRKNLIGFIGFLMLFLSSLSLIGVGFFSESFGLVHFYFSLTFFTLLILSLIILGIHFTLDTSTRLLGVFTLLIGIVSFIFWIDWATIRSLGVAIPEMISIILTSFWIIMLSIRMYRNL